MKNIWRAIQQIPEYRGRIVGVLTFGALTGLVATAVPYIYKAVVDVVVTLAAGHATAGQSAARMLRLLGVFLAIRVASIVVAALQQRQGDNLWLGDLKHLDLTSAQCVPPPPSSAGQQ